MGLQLVWIKRDLRIRDHAPLVEAASRGPVCVLYVYEPPLWAHTEYASCHLNFVERSLDELDDELRARGGRVTRRTGRVVPTLQALHTAWAEHGGVEALWSHQETGLGWTYLRDQAVAAWCAEAGVPWHQFGQDGVCRPHPSRDGWASRWTAAMSRPPLPAPDRLRDVSEVVDGHAHGLPPTPNALGLRAQPEGSALQPAGSAAGLALLHDFVGGRAFGYRRTLSSPNLAFSGCSRLSPHLAWGTVSTRQAWHATQLHLERRRPRARHDREVASFVEDLEAFEGRLRWRGHFMQKLEDEPRLERENLHRAVDGVREPAFNVRKFEAWKVGRTGWPMVDACMRALRHSKWINFRMRAMLASVSSYTLWLHWREPARYLASQFLDFEPGIHFSQFQMQAGTSGINRLRIYDPVKQAREQDPDGRFIRRFVPELRHVPVPFVHEPHRMPTALQAKTGCRIGRDYPAPIVDLRQANRLARARLEAVRSEHGAREQSRAIHAKHGSRKPAAMRRWR